MHDDLFTVARWETSEFSCILTMLDVFSYPLIDLAVSGSKELCEWENIGKQKCIPVGCVPPAHWPYLVVSYARPPRKNHACPPGKNHVPPEKTTHGPPGKTTHAPSPQKKTCMPPGTNHARPPGATMHAPPGATRHAPPEQPHTPPPRLTESQTPVKI